LLVNAGALKILRAHCGCADYLVSTFANAPIRRARGSEFYLRVAPKVPEWLNEGYKLRDLLRGNLPP
jgi:hypothetical protein